MESVWFQGWVFPPMFVACILLFLLFAWLAEEVSKMKGRRQGRLRAEAHARYYRRA